MRDSLGTDAFDKSPLRQFLLFIVGIKLAGIILIFDPSGLQSFDLPKTLFSHSLSWALFAGLLAAFLRFGLGIVPRTRLHLAVGGFVLANLVSLLFAENRYVAFFGEQDRYLGITYLLDMLVLYMTVAVSSRSSRDLVAVLAATAAASAVALAYAGIQAIGLDPVNWLASSRTEPFATFGHPDIFGHFLSFALAVCLGVATIAGSTSRPTLVRVIAVGAGLLCAATAAVVATRGILLGTAGALVVLGFLQLMRRGRKPATSRAVGFGGLATAVLVALLFVSPLGARTAQLSSDVGSGRLTIYEAALRMAFARPAFGYGPDNFGIAYATYRDPPPRGGADPQTSAHDWALQALATTGFVGFAALLCLYCAFALALGRAAMGAARPYAAPLLLGLAAYWAHASVSVGSISVDWFPWLVFGATSSMTGVRRPTFSRSLPRPAGVGVVVLTLIAMGYAAFAFAANRDAGSARIEWGAQRSSLAITSAESATNHDPGRAVYWNWLGLAKHQAGLWQEAAAAFEEAARRTPQESTYLLNLALARGEQALHGDDAQNARAEALEAARRALDADPYSSRVYQIADIAFAFGDFDLTLRAAATTTVFFDPSYGHRTFVAASQALRLDEARRILDASVVIRETSELRAALGETALRMGDRELARASARRALELAPDNGDAIGLLREVGP